MALISVIQFKNEARRYHQERLDRKEDAVKENINYILSTTTYPLTERNLPYIFKDKISEGKIDQLSHQMGPAHQDDYARVKYACDQGDYDDEMESMRFLFTKVNQVNQSRPGKRANAVLVAETFSPTLTKGSAVKGKYTSTREPKRMKP
mgnify:CR=1 FL=1